MGWRLSPSKCERVPTFIPLKTAHQAEVFHASETNGISQLVAHFQNKALPVARKKDKTYGKRRLTYRAALRIYQLPQYQQQVRRFCESTRKQIRFVPGACRVFCALFSRF
jgi:hypothetical protein